MLMMIAVQDQSLDVIADGLSTIRNLAEDMNEVRTAFELQITIFTLKLLQ